MKCAHEPGHVDRHTKYDRQIRLWATSGQASLEQAHVCLVNGNAAGTETLKNLVLPGVGAFTIVDHSVVSEDDVSGNFFLEPRHVGSSIAGAVTERLQELNPDVKGHVMDVPLESVLGSVLGSAHKNAPESGLGNDLESGRRHVLEAADFWSQFAMVIVSGYITPSSLERLKSLLWARNIPLLLVATSGFYAYLHIVVNETSVVETHDPSKPFDLRIDCPWPELSVYSSSFDMDVLDYADHAHVPYIVILIQALGRWKQDHGGDHPRNHSEKEEFRLRYIEQKSRSIRLEKNFVEASKSVHRALRVTLIPNSLQKLLARDEALDLYVGPNTPDFWLYVRALKNFVEKNGGKLPLPGNIPDMASTTASYVRLQAIYRNKAEADKLQFTAELEQVYAGVGRLPSSINAGLVASFCKNAAFLYVSNGSRALVSEPLLRQLHLQDSDLAIYFGILALHQWEAREKKDGFEAFTACFEEITSLQRSDFTPAISSTLHELFTHHVTSYHNICSLIGGIASQEALKIATAQYIPLDNLCIFDGIRSTSSKWKV